jgi:hypothetical protein
MPTPVSQVFYVIGQGATLEAPFTVSVEGQAADLTNSSFRSTIKTDYSLPDMDVDKRSFDQAGNNPGRK